MFRPLLLSLLGALLLAAADAPPSKSALDKPTLEAYVRHLYLLKPEFTVQVVDPKPSAVLPGFLDVSIRVMQQEKLLGSVALMVSKDGKKILQGTVYDVNNNPFKPELDKLKTQFQPALGTAGAPVVLVVFSDLQCPHCKEEANMLRQNLIAAYPKDVRLYFKDFPLETLHPWARAAAIAGRCVFKQKPDEFWGYHDYIFGHQETISLDTLKNNVLEWAKSAKEIDAMQLGQCMDTKATDAEVEAEIAEARSLEINGTPTMFINGRRIPNAIDWPSLKVIVDSEIEYQKTAKNAGDDCGCEVKLPVPGLPTPGAPAISPVKKK
ncbi:MAG TPA: thioredoxin domain-containing protein [Candidatus Acidoferrales bacterium]|nr:thioredoxin domain-containing protein [Candidatus Acidoferrales bacterium]